MFATVKVLVSLLLKLIPENCCHIFIAIDETIKRRSGKNIKQKGCYRDACRSSDSLVIKCFGLKWLCVAMLIKLPMSKREWALPFMTLLCNTMSLIRFTRYKLSFYYIKFENELIF